MPETPYHVQIAHRILNQAREQHTSSEGRYATVEIRLPGEEFRTFVAELGIPARTLDDPSFDLYDPENRIVLGHVFQGYSKKRDAARLTFLACDENVFGMYCSEESFSKLLEQGSRIVRKYVSPKTKNKHSPKKNIPQIKISPPITTPTPQVRVCIPEPEPPQRTPTQERINELERKLRESGKVI